MPKKTKKKNKNVRKRFLNFLKLKTRFSRWFFASLFVVIFTLGGYGHLEPIKAFLQSPLLTFHIGTYEISLYKMLSVGIGLILLFWVARTISSKGVARIKKIRKMNSSNRALLAKTFQIIVYVIIFLVGLDMLGIDLTALAVFSGAVGIGIGFGLQKTTANFISGLILLLERSIEEGDLVELEDGTAGFVRHTEPRYTLIETFDNREMMIPNEDLITKKLTNWTYSSHQGRIEIPVGVAYGADLEKAKELMLLAAKEDKRCSKKNPPRCFLKEFGDSSINFFLYFWLDDITQERWETQSDVMFAIWHKFKENGIEIPFPQRDVTIKNIQDINKT